jgi:streptogramin lyase
MTRREKQPDWFGSAAGNDAPAGVRHTARRRRQRGLRPVLDPLESRRLLTSISETAVVGDPTQLTFGSDGNLWFTEPSSNEVGYLNPSNPSSVSQIPLLGAIGGDPQEITATGTGSTGAIWFTLKAVDQFGMLNLNHIANGPQYFLGAGEMPGGAGITSVGSDLWFAMPPSNDMGVFDITAQSSITPHTLSPADITNFQSQITVGPVGTVLWFTEPGAIGIFNTSTFQTTQVSLPSSGGTQIPAGITLGPDGNIWFTESVPNAGGSGFVSSAVGVIDVHNANSIKEFPTPAASQPSGITKGPDGNVWFTETAAGAIGFVNVAGLSGPSEYTLGAAIPIPTTVVKHPAPLGIIEGGAGQVWFADKSGAIGVVNLTHLVITTPPPSTATAGTGFGFTVKAENSSGVVDTQFNGNVTVALASSPGGALTTLPGKSLTVAAINGVATFSGLTLDTVGAQYTLQATSNAADPPTVVVTSGINVVPAVASKLSLAAQPPTSVAAGQGFSLTVEVEDAFDNIVTNYSGAATVTLATNAGGAGTVLSGTTTLNFSPAGSTPGYVTFTGLSLNNAGTGYQLKISSPALGSTTSNTFNVTGMQPPDSTPPQVVSASAVMTQKLNRRGKKIGKPILSGYTINFSTAMDQSALMNHGSYAIDLLKKIKTKVTRAARRRIKIKTPVYKPIAFRVTDVTSNSVTLTLAGKQTFPKGGRLTVFANSVDNTSHVFMAQNVVLTISRKGKSIS